jgi:hypothetical protein
MADEEKGKKTALLCIIRILKEHSDEEHPLSQQQIIDYLEEEYGLSINRKSVRRNLERIREAGFPVTSREVDRENNGKKSQMTRDWHWVHPLSREERGQILDTLYFSHLPPAVIRKLSRKLQDMGSSFYPDEKMWVRSLAAPEWSRTGLPVSYILAAISEAIAGRHKIQFTLDTYGPDLKRSSETGTDGRPLVITASPYLICASDGIYSLLCNVDGDKDITMFRVERMNDIVILKETLISQKTLEGTEGNLKVSDYAACIHQICFGRKVVCRLSVHTSLIMDMMEQFGRSAHIVSAVPNEVEAEVEASMETVEQWAFLHAPLVRVLSPDILVKTMRDKIAVLSRKYNR